VVHQAFAGNIARITTDVRSPPVFSDLRAAWLRVAPR
jgi:hypothetical protein